MTIDPNAAAPTGGAPSAFGAGTPSAFTAQRAVPEAWHLSLQYKGNKIAPTLPNVLIILSNDKRWSGCLAYDNMENSPRWLKAPPWEADPTTLGGRAASPQLSFQLFASRLIRDVDQLSLVCWLSAVWGMDITSRVAAEALSQAAELTVYDPLATYLSGLEWDNTSRIESWLSTYLGADDTSLVREIGKRWLVSAVARAYVPGCRVDTMLVLEGPQGRFKSTAVETLAGQFYTDEAPDFTSKDGKLSNSGVWIREFGELANMDRADVNRIKAFLSCKEDRYRAPYGRTVQAYPRRCVFVGTTNDSTYLRDETGNRRYWPVVCGQIALEALRADRDQLWAEAVVAYRSGAKWWFDAAEHTEDLRATHAQRLSIDPLEEKLTALLAAHETTTVGEVLDLLEAPLLSRDKRLGNRIGSVLRRIGFEQKGMVGTARAFRRTTPGWVSPSTEGK